MPSASAVDGFEKIKNTLKLLAQSILLLFALQLIANLQARNYSEDKLQCFLSLVSKGLEKSKTQYSNINNGKQIAICSESYGNFALTTHEKKITRKSDDGLIDSDWMTEYESDQSSSQTRLPELSQKKDVRMAALAKWATNSNRSERKQCQSKLRSKQWSCTGGSQPKRN